MSNKYIDNYLKKNNPNFKSELDNVVNQLYQNENIFKVSFKVVLPSLLLTLLMGIYIFIDQMLIINLVPLDGHNYLEQYFSSINQIDLYTKISNFMNDNPSSQLLITDNKSFIVYTTNQLGVFSLIVLSFGYLISAGSAVLFSKSIALNQNDYRQKITSTSFYSSLIFAILATIIMMVIQNYVLDSMMPSSSTLKESDFNNLVNNYGVTFNDVQNYFNIYYHQAVVYQASRYIYFINAGIVFSCYINLFVFYLRAEAKNLVVTIIGVVANILNIIFDIIFIVVLKVGIMGGGFATFLGQFINIFVILMYLIYLNKKDWTSIKFEYLKDIKLDYKIVLNSITLGSSTFLRELSLAIANIVYVPIFLNTIGHIDNNALNSFAKLAASPIYNLFFFAIFGIIDGLRPIISYNYSIKNYKRVRQTFYVGTLFSLVYSFVVIGLVFAIIPNSKTILESLNVSVNDPNMYSYDKNNLLILLASMMLQFPFISLSISGMAIFQSANKKVMNFILSIMQGALTFYPILYSMSAIALSTNNAIVMVFTGFTNIAVSSIIILIFTLLFLYKYIDTNMFNISFNKNKKVNHIQPKL